MSTVRTLWYIHSFQYISMVHCTNMAMAVIEPIDIVFVHNTSYTYYTDQLGLSILSDGLIIVCGHHEN